MFKVMHIADIHLCGGPETDEAKALMKAVEIVHREKVELVCLNGDIYHSKSTPEQRLVFLEFIRKCLQSRASVIILRGNHDEKDDLKVFQYWDRVHVFEEPGDFSHFFKDGSALDIHTIPHFNAAALALQHGDQASMGDTGSSLFDDIIEGIRQEIHRFDGPSMVLFHGSVTEAKLDNGMIPKQDGIMLNGPLLSSLGVPVRGGHYHAHQEMHPNVVYSGSITLRNYGETGDKGVVIDTWDGEWKPFDFISLEPSSRFTVEADFISLAGEEPFFQMASGDFCNPGVLYPKLQDLISECFKSARVRFRYKVKQSDIPKMDLEPVKQFFWEAGVREVKFERDLVIETAVRSESIQSATTVFDHHKEWLCMKGLDDKIESQKEVYSEVCGDSSGDSDTQALNGPGELQDASLPNLPSQCNSDLSPKFTEEAISA
ncbi:MAG: metallophosphoesterase family protein [Endozoicomonas sp.]